MKIGQFCRDLNCHRERGHLVKKNKTYGCGYPPGYFNCIYLSKEGKIIPQPFTIYTEFNKNELAILSALVRHERQHSINER